MMLFPILIATSLCAFGPMIDIHAFELSDPIVQEEGMQSVTYPNGVRLYVKQLPAGPLSIRVVVKKSATQQMIYSVDAQERVLPQLEEFFAYCKAALQGEEGRKFSTSTTSRNADGGEVSVVVVGDVADEGMRDLIAHYVANLPLQVVGDRECAIHIDKTARAGSDVALHVDYPLEQGTSGTLGELRDQWVGAFVQELYQQRLERATRHFDETWIHSHQRFLFPRPGYALTKHDDVCNVLGMLLWQAEAIKKGGYDRDELNEARLRIRSALQYLVAGASHVDSRTLGNYYVDHILHSASIPAYQDFLAASLDLIETISLSDLNEKVGSFLDEANRSIALVYPEQNVAMALRKQDVEILLTTISDGVASYEQGSSSTEPVLLLDRHTVRGEGRNLPILLAKHAIDLDTAEAVDLFEQLPLTSSEEKIIEKIVSTMADKNIFQLALSKRDLEKNGRKIDHVHPMRFIGFIFSDSQLKKCVRQIKKSSFKWDAFIDGFSRRMKEEMGKNNLMLYVPGFAEVLDVDPEEVATLIHKHDYEGLVRFLM